MYFNELDILSRQIQNTVWPHKETVVESGIRYVCISLSCKNGYRIRGYYDGVKSQDRGIGRRIMLY